MKSAKRVLILIVLLVFISCEGQLEKPKEIKVVEAIEEVQEPKVKRIKSLQELSFKRDSIYSYDQVVLSIKEQKKQVSKADLNLDSISKLFKASLLHRIIPYWEGTKWSFEGHTSKPKTGEIACGYFVSTTLMHVGLNINRYKLAQQNPLNEAKSLLLGTELIKISEASIENNINAIRSKLKEGIYFIGFGESHVGYIIKEKEELYLIHSNYIGSEGVIIEEIESSKVFS